jgi:hypothetical protein
MQVLRLLRSVSYQIFSNSSLKKWSYYLTLYSVIQNCRSFLGRLPKFSTDYEEIISRAHGNFQEQKKFLESSTIIINYWIIIIIIINADYN